VASEEFNPYAPPRTHADEPPSVHSGCPRLSRWRFLFRGGSAVCPRCGAHLELSRAYQSLWAVAGLVLVVGGTAWSVRAQSGLPVAVAIVAAIIGEVVATARAPVRVVNEAVVRVRRLAGVTVLALAVVGLLVVLWQAFWR
jgi:hypothetical protein